MFSLRCEPALKPAYESGSWWPDRDIQLSSQMETIQYIVAIDVGEYVCVAAGGSTTVQLVIRVGSSKVVSRNRFDLHLMLRNIKRGH